MPKGDRSGPVRYADDVPCSIRAHHEIVDDGTHAWCVWCGLLFRFKRTTTRRTPPATRNASANKTMRNASAKKKGRGRRSTRQLLALQGSCCAECGQGFGPEDPVHRYHHMLFCASCIAIIRELERTDTFSGAPAVRFPS